MTEIVDEEVSWFGVPVDFAGSDAGAKTRYVRECNALRRTMPAGECRIAPQVSLSDERGRPVAAGTVVSAADFGPGETGRSRLENLILTGHVVRSEQQSAAERAEIVAHVERTRAINAAFVADTPAAKLDQLLAQQGKA